MAADDGCFSLTGWQMLTKLCQLSDFGGSNAGGMRMKRLVIIGLILALVAPLSAQEEERVLPYSALMSSAKIYLGQKRKDFDAARQRLQEAIDNYDDPLEAYFLLGLINSEKSEYEEMIANFEKFREICARAEDENNKKLKKRCEKDKMPKQINEIIVSEWNSSFGDGVADLKLADSLSKHVDAIADDSARAAMEVGIQKFYENARQDFATCTMLNDATDAEELDTLKYKAWTNWGMVEGRLDNLETAVEKYQISYEMNPNDVGLLPDLANSLYKLGRMDEAVKYYEEMAEKDSLNASWALTYAAICYQNTNERDKLKSVFDRILEMSPDDAQIHYQRGIYYIQEATSAEIQDTLKILDSLSAANPNDKSIDEAKKAVMEHRLSFYQKAMPDFRAAALIDTNDVDYQYWYGTSAYFSDDLEAAKGIYERCVELDDTYKDCWCGLELIYARLKMNAEYDKAKAKCAE
jgi:pentatricopeptide repeat protein